MNKVLTNVEFEKKLLKKLPIHFQNNFRIKLRGNNDNYWQTLSEARAIIIFNNLGILVKEIDVKTIKNKDVDFFAEFEKEKIYMEVKGFVPEDYEIAKNGRMLGTDDVKIIRALNRARPKFFNSSCNILVIADENTTKKSLFENHLMDKQKIPGKYLNCCCHKYIKTSAIMILGGLYENQLFKFKIWYNANPEKLLPQKVVNIFDLKKANIY